jgi:hypothetical protein
MSNSAAIQKIMEAKINIVYIANTPEDIDALFAALPNNQPISQPVSEPVAQPPNTEQKKQG